jgi:S-methylmethionine-dependent homocysteine/selenocysteine methylase
MMAKESPMQAVATKLAHGDTVLLDGATGTELQRRGVPMDDAAWCALAALTHPEVLQAVHEDYLRLGAEVITTNTFASARHMMARAGRAEDTIPGYRAAVAAARAARDRSAGGRPVVIAGSISTMRPILPHADRRDPRAAVPKDEARASLREAAQTLAEAGVDLLLLEMVSDLDWGPLLIDEALATGLPVWVGLSARRAEDGHLHSYHEGGPSFEDLVQGVSGSGVQAIGVMHSAMPEMAAALDLVRRHWQGPMLAYPEAGWFEMPDWRFIEVDPEGFADAALRWVRQGAQIVGGCCGLGPAHIGALARRLRPG